MAVPSSGQLSLFGIAMEKIHAAYAEPNPVPLGQHHVGPGMPTTAGDHKLFDAPSNEPVNDFYSTNITVKASSPPFTQEDAFANEHLNQLAGASGYNVIGDISLVSMQTNAVSSQGYRNPSFTSNDGHPMTKLHKNTYVGDTAPKGPVGFSAPGAGHDHPSTVQSSTVMYVMYIGDSTLEADISPPNNIGYYAIAYGFNPSIFQDGRAISLGGTGHTGQYWGTAGPSPLPSGNAEPGNFEGIPFYHPQPNSINTTSPAPHPFPSTANSDLSMSNFYAYDHDFVAQLTPGIHVTSTSLFSGNQGTGLLSYDVDFSSPTHLGAAVAGNPATSIYYIICYKNGGGTPSFTGDVQFTNFHVYGPPSPTPYTFGPPTSPYLPSHKTSVTNPPSPTPLNIAPHKNTPATPGANADSVVTSYDPKMTTTVSTSNTSGRWVYKSTGKPPSTGTGVTDPTGYFYCETSGPSPTRRGGWNILYGPVGRAGSQITSNTMQFKFYANGANIGTCFVGLYIGY